MINTLIKRQQQSIDVSWFVGGRVERHIKGTPYSHAGDIQIIVVKGRTPWTRRLMLAITNVQMLCNGERHNCSGPRRPDVIRLRNCHIELLDGNCIVIDPGNSYRYTLYPFTQNWKALEAQLSAP